MPQLETAMLVPATGGFGQYQLTPWQREGDYELNDFASDSGYEIAESPGGRFFGLIQGESDADGWLIRMDVDGPDDLVWPMAYRLVEREAS